MDKISGHVRLINLTCPGNHKHEPWGAVHKGSKRVLATSLEVHYPLGLCKAIVEAYLSKLAAYGFQKVDLVPNYPAAQALSGKQPRTGRMLPMFPEHKSKILALSDANKLRVWPLPIPNLEHCKLLHSFQVGGMDGVEDVSKTAKNICSAFKMAIAYRIHCHPVLLRCRSSVPWEPMEFVEKAVSFEHPVAVTRAVPSVLLAAIGIHSNLSKVDIAKNRLKTILYWNSRSKSLRQEEEALKASMDPVVAKTVSCKRILLFREMLEASGYEDVDDVNDLIDGAKLVGNVPVTGVLPSKFVPATSTREALARQSDMLKSIALYLASLSGDIDIDNEVWFQTLSELHEGWLRGPFDLRDILSCPITRRFGLR